MEVIISFFLDCVGCVMFSSGLVCRGGIQMMEKYNVENEILKLGS